MINKVRHLLWAGAVVVGCGAAPRSAPRAFAESAAYRALKGRIVAFHESDLNGDGDLDAVLFQREGDGFVPTVYVQRIDGERVRWERQCFGPPLLGERFEPLRWVRDGQDRRLLVEVTTEDPDEVHTSLAVLDTARPCEPVLENRMRFEKPSGTAVAPEGLRVGVSVSTEGDLLVLDRPQTRTFRGTWGKTELLTSLRLRKWGGSASLDSWGERRVGLMSRLERLVTRVPAVIPRPDTLTGRANKPGTFTGTPVRPNQPGAWIPPKGDGSAASASGRDSAWTLLPGEGDRLRINTAIPFVLLELHHGCEPSLPIRLEVRAESGGSLLVGGRPPPLNSTFVASASGKSIGETHAVEFLALSRPTAELTLQIGPVDSKRCIRELRTYRWRVGGSNAP